MLIAQIEPPHLTRGGDWHYRTHSPGLAMAEQDGVSVVDLRSSHPSRDELFDCADVVVLNMLCDPDLLPLIDERTRRGQPTVFELNDDVAALSSHSPTAAFYRNPEHQLLFRMLVHACTAVQFSTRELQRLYGRFARTSTVFENQLLPSLLSAAPRPPHDGPVVVGWGGSAGHFDDLAAIAPALSAWFLAHDGVELHLMCNDRIWALFDALDPAKKRHVPPGSLEEYHRFVATLDVGLAPLRDTSFNRSRSDVKFLEYAAHGVVPVLANVTPYRDSLEPGTTGFYFNDTNELLSHLEQLCSRPELRARISDSVFHHVAEGRSERGQASRRIDFYRSLLPAPADPSQNPWFEQQSNRSEVSTQGRYVTLGPTEYERLIHHALVLGQQEQRKAESLSLLERASALEPGAYLPHLFSAVFGNAPDSCLERALQLNPRSLRALVLLAEHQFASRKLSHAIANLLRAAELCPSYDIPYVRLARFMAQLGQTEEANSFARLAAQLRAPFAEPATEAKP